MLHRAELTDRLPIRVGRFEIWPGRRLMLRDGRPCEVGGRAFDLLLVLLRHRHRVVSVAEQMDEVWPGLAVEPNNVQVQVWALRRLLGRQAIATVPRRGYRLVEPAFGPDDWAPPPGHAVHPPRAGHGSPTPCRVRLRWNPRAD